MKQHIQSFVKWKCASDILALKIFPNAKEVTESIGAYSAVKNHMLHKIGAEFISPKIAVVCVGDGVTPRTGSIFAFRSAWTCYSIDPNLKMLNPPIKRLICLKRRIEDEILDLTDFDQVIIVMVHSHATIKNTLRSIKGKRLHLVCIPCCVMQDIPNVTYLGYKDTSIWSPKNEVKIWFDVSL